MRDLWNYFRDEPNALWAFLCSMVVVLLSSLGTYLSVRKDLASAKQSKEDRQAIADANARAASANQHAAEAFERGEKASERAASAEERAAAAEVAGEKLRVTAAELSLKIVEQEKTNLSMQHRLMEQREATIRLQRAARPRSELFRAVTYFDLRKYAGTKVQVGSISGEEPAELARRIVTTLSRAEWMVAKNAIGRIPAAGVSGVMVFTPYESTVEVKRAAEYLASQLTGVGISVSGPQVLSQNQPINTVTVWVKERERESGPVPP